MLLGCPKSLLEPDWVSVKSWNRNPVLASSFSASYQTIWLPGAPQASHACSIVSGLQCLGAAWQPWQWLMESMISSEMSKQRKGNFFSKQSEVRAKLLPRRPGHEGEMQSGNGRLVHPNPGPVPAAHCTQWDQLSSRLRGGGEGPCTGQEGWVEQSRPRPGCRHRPDK